MKVDKNHKLIMETSEGNQRFAVVFEDDPVVTIQTITETFEKRAETE
jgi:hypothetical protein